MSGKALKITAAVLLTLLSAALLFPAAGLVGEGEAEASEESSLEALPWTFVYVSTDSGEGFYLPLPEREEDSYTYPLVQLRSDGTKAINNIRVTPEGVSIVSANCDNQDCVHQGMLTLANRDIRPLGNFIICLPHRVWLSLYTAEEILAMLEQN